MAGKTHITRFALSAVLILALAFVPVAFADKGRNGGGKNNTTSGDPSLNLVLLDSTDGVPHYGQSVTFDVVAPVMYPWVQVTCNQNGMWVFGQYVGFYAGYSGSQAFVLRSYLWPGGAADCDARLYDSLTDRTLATTSFHVNP